METIKFIKFKDTVQNIETEYLVIDNYSVAETAVRDIVGGTINNIIFNDHIMRSPIPPPGFENPNALGRLVLKNLGESVRKGIVLLMGSKGGYFPYPVIGDLNYEKLGERVVRYSYQKDNILTLFE